MKGRVLGLSYRTAKRKDYLNKTLLEFEAGTLKDPKEYTQRSTGGSYKFGKLNSVIYLRASIGHQHEIFKKADLGGIAVRYFVNAGPVLAVYKPIYYKVAYIISTSGSIYNVEYREEKFQSSFAIPAEIYGKAAFTKGLNEIKFLPGAFVKAGFNFEYSKQDKLIHAIEIGGQLNAFPARIPIMAMVTNKFLYPSIFVSYRFGMIIDPLNPDSNKFSNIFKRNKETTNP